MLAEQSAQHVDDPRRSNRAGYIDREALPGVLVDDRQALEFLTIGTGVEDEIIGPDLVADAGRQWPGARSRYVLPRPLAGHLEVGLAPEPMAALGAHRMAFSGHEDPNAPVAVTRIPGGQLTHDRNGWGISCLHDRLVMQRETGHGQQRARSPLRYTEPDRMLHGPSACGRA